MSQVKTEEEMSLRKVCPDQYAQVHLIKLPSNHSEMSGRK